MPMVKKQEPQASVIEGVKQAAAGQFAQAPEADFTKYVVATKPAKAVAYGRELSEYELQKDRKIGVAGITQAIIQSPVYAQFLMTVKSAEEANVFLKTQVEFWVNTVKELSEGK